MSKKRITEELICANPITADDACAFFATAAAYSRAATTMLQTQLRAQFYQLPDEADTLYIFFTGISCAELQHLNCQHRFALTSDDLFELLSSSTLPTGETVVSRQRDFRRQPARFTVDDFRLASLLKLTVSYATLEAEDAPLQFLRCLAKLLQKNSKLLFPIWTGVPEMDATLSIFRQLSDNLTEMKTIANVLRSVSDVASLSVLIEKLTTPSTASGASKRL